MTCPGQEWNSHPCGPAECPTPGACSAAEVFEELRAKLAAAEAENVSIRQMLSMALLHVPPAHEAKAWPANSRVAGEAVLKLWDDVERYKIGRAVLAQETSNV
jgi:hypothetical protein